MQNAAEKGSGISLRPSTHSPYLDCARTRCPLNRVKTGILVRIKQLCANEETAQRLREIGLGEEQLIRLLTCHTNIICQVCSARLAISPQLAETILVEPCMEVS